MKIKIVAAVFGVLLALGVITVGTTLAKTNVQGVVSGALTAAADQATATNRCQAWDTELAKQLGIDVSKLVGAQKATAKALVDQGVKDGKLTADQATKLKERIDAANWADCPRLPGQGGPIGRGNPGPVGGMMGRALKIGGDAAAKALNMTTPDLANALRSGKSVADLAKEKGVALDTVKKAIVDAETAQIDQAVKDGKLTADQATKLKDGLNQRIDNYLQFKYSGPAGKPGPHRGR
ncbi:MAG: hypothetical protein HZB53_04515 [Chloroflexi bacterium]|nr:hypothetical protein [Chloroflexota bacterium]